MGKLIAEIAEITDITRVLNTTLFLADVRELVRFLGGTKNNAEIAQRELEKFQAALEFVNWQADWEIEVRDQGQGTPQQRFWLAFHWWLSRVERQEPSDSQPTWSNWISGDGSMFFRRDDVPRAVYPLLVFFWWIVVNWISISEGADEDMQSAQKRVLEGFVDIFAGDPTNIAWGDIAEKDLASKSTNKRLQAILTWLNADRVVLQRLKATQRAAEDAGASSRVAPFFAVLVEYITVSIERMKVEVDEFRGKTHRKREQASLLLHEKDAKLRRLVRDAMQRQHGQATEGENMALTTYEETERVLAETQDGVDRMEEEFETRLAEVDEEDSDEDDAALLKKLHEEVRSDQLVNNLRRNIAKLRATLAEERQATVAARNEKEKAEALAVVLEREKTNAEQEKDNTMKTIFEKRKEIKDLKTQLDDTKTELAKVQGERDALTKEQAQRKTELEALRTKLTEAEKSGPPQDLLQLRKKLAKLTEDLRATKADLENKSVSETELKARLQRGTASLTTANNEVARLQKLADERLVQIGKLEDQLNEATGNVKRANKQLTDVKKQLTAAEKKLTDETQRAKNLEDKLRKIKGANDRAMETKDADMKKLRDEIEKLKTDIVKEKSRKEKGTDEMEAELAQKTEEFAALQKRTKKERKELGKLRGQLQELGDAKQRYATAQDELTRSRKARVKLETQLENAKAELQLAKERAKQSGGRATSAQSAHRGLVARNAPQKLLNQVAVDHYNHTLQTLIDLYKRAQAA